ncbi:MAG: manganese efflux pump, partial [Clostridia bacterium]
MSLVSILLTSFALSMDAFAVSITKGMTLKNISTKLAFKIAFFFGLFQGGMPLIGWALGISFESYIKSFDHWIALILLSFLGIKMIYESIKGNNADEIAIDLDVCELN